VALLFGLRYFEILCLFRFQHGPRHFPGERVLSGIRQAETGGKKNEGSTHHQPPLMSIVFLNIKGRSITVNAI
jgi:hypothetical protein